MYKRRSFNIFPVQQNSARKKHSAPNDFTHRMLKNFTSRHIWRNRSSIKAAVKSINFHFYLSNHITEKTKFFNYDVQMVLTVMKTNTSSLKLKLGQSILLTAVAMMMFQGFLSWLSKQNNVNIDTLMLMWKKK